MPPLFTVVKTDGRLLPSRASLPLKLVFAAIATVAVSTGARAFAASIEVNPTGLGAGDNVIASCGSGLAFAYTTAFDSRVSGYAVHRINLSSIPKGCLGKDFSVTFYNSNGDTEGSAIRGTLPVSGTSKIEPVAASSNPIDASRIGGVSVVIP